MQSVRWVGCVVEGYDLLFSLVYGFVDGLLAAWLEDLKSRVSLVCLFDGPCLLICVPVRVLSLFIAFPFVCVCYFFTGFFGLFVCWNALRFCLVLLLFVCLLVSLCCFFSLFP